MSGVFNKYKYLLIVLLFLTIISISYFNCRNTEEIIRDKYQQRQELVENSIIKSLYHINDAYKIAEEHLNQKMEEYSLQLRDLYHNNQEIFTWDLEELKKRFDGYDIYIINSNLEIIRSTFETDVGFDFKKFPGFSKVLKGRLERGSFAVDRLDLETSTGEIKKYSYMPTHDKKYLLELSVDLKTQFPILADVNIFAEAIELTKKYDLVEEVSFYKYCPDTEDVGKLRNTKDPVDTNISEREKEFVRKAFVSRQKQAFKENFSGSSYSYTFIPALIPEEDSDTQWWNSFIIAINYNNEIMFKEISRSRDLFLINALIMVILFLVFILSVIYLLRKFEYMAYHDQLTGLPNRILFEGNMNKIISEKDNTETGKKIVLIFMDINNFKEVNDNFGHDIGDKVLQETAERLRDSFLELDYISRLGGDEFTAAISSFGSNEEIKKIAADIIKIFDKPFLIEGSEFFISVSVGISIYPEHATQLEELIKKADFAMYQAKEKQRDYILYNSAI